MSETNGAEVIRVGRKGLRKFAIGDGPVFEIDVWATMNAYLKMRRSFSGEDGKVAPENNDAFEQSLAGFVKDVTQTDGLTVTEQLEFLKVLDEEAEKLRSFFTRKDAAAPSSAPSTEVRFGT